MVLVGNLRIHAPCLKLVVKMIKMRIGFLQVECTLGRCHPSQESQVYDAKRDADRQITLCLQQVMQHHCLMLSRHFLLLCSCFAAFHQRHGLLSHIVYTPECCAGLAPIAVKIMDSNRKFPLVLRGGQLEESDKLKPGKAEKQASPLSYMYDAEDDLNEPV